MASTDDDFDKLMAETERMLAGPTPAKSAAPARRADPAVAPASGRFESSIRTSAVSGSVAAVLVFVAFALTPFLGAISGAAGAFVATFVIMLVQRITRGKS